VTKRKLDRATLEDIEDVLMRADLGTDTAARIAAALASAATTRPISPDDVKAVVATEVEKVLAPVAKPLVIDPRKSRSSFWSVGVNGSGKTTTIGKLAAKFRAEGRKRDAGGRRHFRAAAIEQLKIWGERTGAPVIARAGRRCRRPCLRRAHRGARRAARRAADRYRRPAAKPAELMNELEKVVRVIKKVDASAPHAVLLVLDATVGQNALSQVEIFIEKSPASPAW
jgi:fused signal recognition particle receptor